MPFFAEGTTCIHFLPYPVSVAQLEAAPWTVGVHCPEVERANHEKFNKGETTTVEIWYEYLDEVLKSSSHGKIVSKFTNEVRAVDVIQMTDL